MHLFFSSTGIIITITFFTQHIQQNKEPISHLKL